MNVFNPVAVAKNIVARYKPGDVIGADTVSELVDVREPRNDDLFGIGKALVLDRLQRVSLLREELLETHKILAVSEAGGLELVLPAHQIDRALLRVKLKVDKVLRRGVGEVLNLGVNGPLDPLAMEQRDAAVYLDALRLALNPRSRRLKIANVVPLKAAR